jgi:hypothetical protein
MKAWQRRYTSPQRRRAALLKRDLCIASTDSTHPTTRKRNTIILAGIVTLDRHSSDNCVELRHHLREGRSIAFNACENMRFQILLQKY